MALVKFTPIFYNKLRKVGDQSMEKPIREFSGRAFSAEEIELIKWTIKTYPKLSIAELANTVSEFLEWKQINGKPKTSQSTALLKKLEMEGVIELPPKKEYKKSKEGTGKENISGDAGKESAVLISETPGISEKAMQKQESTSKATDGNHKGIFACGKIELAIAEGETETKRWKTSVQRYHMLGCKNVYGAQLRYFVKSGNEELGCLQFSASAWALCTRDNWIGWTVEDKKARLHLIINNSRFLVYPWVHVDCMASRALSLAARRIEKDWLNAYNYAPVLLETFVDSAYYAGTSYKASNWRYLGQTRGRGRYDRYNERPLTEKAVYVYPLHRDFREILKGEKPYKVVPPNE